METNLVTLTLSQPVSVSLHLHLMPGLFHMAFYPLPTLSGSSLHRVLLDCLNTPFLASPQASAQPAPLAGGALSYLVFKAHFEFCFSLKSFLVFPEAS